MKNITIGQWIFLILSLAFPLLYLLMFYYTFWNGEEPSLADTGVLNIILLITQCISFVLAVLRLCFAKLRNSDSCLLALVVAFFFITSFAVTSFFGIFFLLELFHVPWFPAQS